MELVIKDIRSVGDIRLFKELAKRLGLKTVKLTTEEKEDIALGAAIKKGRASGYTQEADILKTLRKAQRKK